MYTYVQQVNKYVRTYMQLQVNKYVRMYVHLQVFMYTYMHIYMYTDSDRARVVVKATNFCLTSKYAPGGLFASCQQI